MNGQAAAGNAADVNSSHLMPAATADQEADSVALNGVVMNEHEDKPFRLVYYN